MSLVWERDVVGYTRGEYLLAIASYYFDAQLDVVDGGIWRSRDRRRGGAVREGRGHRDEIEDPSPEMVL